MGTATFRFYGPLNDFLPRHLRHRPFEHPAGGRSTVKDTLEALGVPHPEIALVLVHGEPVGFDSFLRPGDRVSVFPAFFQWDLRGTSRVLPPALGEVRFLVDVNLGKLARYLRLLGWDTAYSAGARDDELARKSREEERILLTRDPGLLKHACVLYGYWVRSVLPTEQVLEVVRRFSLAEKALPGTRCLLCNGLLFSRRREELPQGTLDGLPPRVRERHEEFRLCPGCGKIYWAGTHWDRMQGLAAGILQGEHRQPDA
jgi:uncharacterized protein with PIN domain/sulfur carrier protein ThiS